jgi:hypothetical protein
MKEYDSFVAFNIQHNYYSTTLLMPNIFSMESLITILP